MTFMWDGGNLFFGKIYVGSILRIVPEGWREYPVYRLPPEDDAPDNVKAARKYNERYEKTPWRGWLMTNDEGESVGFWATELEAKAELETLARKAIMEE